MISEFRAPRQRFKKNLEAKVKGRGLDSVEIHGISIEHPIKHQLQHHQNLLKHLLRSIEIRSMRG